MDCWFNKITINSQLLANFDSLNVNVNKLQISNFDIYLTDESYKFQNLTVVKLGYIYN